MQVFLKGVSKHLTILEPLKAYCSNTRLSHLCLRVNNTIVLFNCVEDMFSYTM